METLNLAATAASSMNLSHLLTDFLVLVAVLAVAWGLMWGIEKWIHPIPQPVKLVLAIGLLILVILWAMSNFGYT